MIYQFLTCDVFTKHAFRGNQLAVIPEANGLNDEQMQQIAREFNFSETTFVFPPEHGQTNRVKIFTPTSEVPFAGHPNLGTTFTLYQNGYLGNMQIPLKITFEEAAGLVPISSRKRRAATFFSNCRLLSLLYSEQRLMQKLLAGLFV